MSTEPEKDAAGQPAAQGASEPPAPAEDFTVPERPDEAVAEAIRKLQAEKQQLTDQLLRKQAEVENVRKRLTREKEEFQQFSLFQAVESLIPVLDGFELALQSNGSGEDYRKGVELIYQQLYGALRRLGLETVESEGKQFNPYMHEAVSLVETDEVEDQQILAELQRGYLFKNRLLRPARVKVAQRPAAQPNPSSPSNGTSE
jgi:molecular chaperone GrpE